MRSADIVVEMDRDQVAPFVEALGTTFYADEDTLRRAVMSSSSTNVIHQASDRQWRDILGILLVRGETLDRAYVDDTAVKLQLNDLLERARREVQGR